MDRAYYFDVLYPFQDRALKILGSIETGLYLTGGTAVADRYRAAAAPRRYLGPRMSVTDL